MTRIANEAQIGPAVMLVTASATFMCSQTIHGCRPTSAVIHPDSTATTEAIPATAAHR